MTARIYVIPVSNPAAAGRAMVAYKRIPHRVVNLMPGLHPMLVRFAGFEGFTVPALELDGHKVQGSRQIARHLDAVRPDPPLFPPDPEQRKCVEEDERWGEAVLQPIPRRLFRYLMLSEHSARMWMGSDVMGLPVPELIAPLFMPVIRRLAQISHANESEVRAAVTRLPELLDHVDTLMADGTIGGVEPNAADFQILASVRVLLEFEDLRRLVRGRACEPAARRLYPRWAGPIPAGLPSLS